MQNFARYSSLLCNGFVSLILANDLLINSSPRKKMRLKGVRGSRSKQKKAKQKAPRGPGLARSLSGFHTGRNTSRSVIFFHPIPEPLSRHKKEERGTFCGFSRHPSSSSAPGRQRIGFPKSLSHMTLSASPPLPSPPSNSL